jgi:pimeloyl-ACP methyl ester carboxylesterase
MLFLRFWLLILILLPLTQVQAETAPQSTQATLEELGGYPCPESELTCVKLTMPLDHFDESVEGTIDVVFGVRPADGERRGMWLLAMGGPGTSGLSVADRYYLPFFDRDLLEHLDIVFFDQRGLKQSGGVECLNAIYYDEYADPGDTLTPKGEMAFVESTRQFTENCIKETGKAAILPYLGTRQVAEDLEVFRQAMGVEKFYLHGESYGTQVAQTYTAAYPERLQGLILDGTVDATLSGVEFLEQQTAAFQKVLLMTLEACNADAVCAADFGGDALTFYDDLTAELKAGDMVFDFPLPSGVPEARLFYAIDLENTASSALYGVADRTILLRVLASARRGDLVPLARLSYMLLGYDPITLEPVIDPTSSDAIFYAVNCTDYHYFEGSSQERARAYLRAGDEIEQRYPYMSGGFYGDFPCVFWPGQQNTQRPESLSAEGVPTLVLGATADPATPVGMGEAVFSRLDDGYLITAEGGDHVIFGRGDSCPDNIVTAFLLEGSTPAARESRCNKGVISDYTALPPANASEFATVEEVLSALYDEIYYLPEYYYWDFITPASVGCRYSGLMTFKPTNAGAAFEFENCAFFSGFVMNGTGEDNLFGDGSFELNISGSGIFEGDFHYQIAADGESTISEYANSSFEDVAT